MKCDCIKKVEEKLKQASGDPNAKIDVMLTFPKMNERIYIPYTFREKKKDGTFGKEKAGKLALTKCPFCGEDQV